MTGNKVNMFNQEALSGGQAVDAAQQATVLVKPEVKKPPALSTCQQAFFSAESTRSNQADEPFFDEDRRSMLQSAFL